MGKNIFSYKKQIFFLFILLSGIYFLIDYLRVGSDISRGREEDYPEAAELSGRVLSFEELKGYFQEVSQRKGARYAFEVLRVALVPPNTDMHLLGHVVGDELYKQEGLKGITACTNDFRNACSHSIVVGLFFDRGEQALPDIAQVCRQAPGGSGAYTMCFHGLGHGILAYSGYDMEKANNLCRKTGTPEGRNREAIECTGGTVMEIIGGGFHDRHLWEEQRKKFLNKDKPLSLCQNNFILDDARFMCYVYLTPYLFEAVGADLGTPTAENFQEAFKYCDKLTASEGFNRDACFGGFGKEFIGLVQGRDIRKESLENISDEQLSQVYEWCKLAPIKEGSAACIVHAVNSLYWGGENNRSVSIRFCNVMTNELYFQKSCFINLISVVASYIQDPEYRRSFCNELPLEIEEDCKVRLLRS